MVTTRTVVEEPGQSVTIGEDGDGLDLIEITVRDEDCGRLVADFS